MMVVEVELRRVVKEHFPDLAVEGVAFGIHLQAELPDGLVRVFPKFEKAALAGKPIGLQQNLVFAVVNDVVGEMLVSGCLLMCLSMRAPYSNDRDEAFQEIVVRRR